MGKKIIDRADLSRIGLPLLRRLPPKAPDEEVSPWWPRGKFPSEAVRLGIRATFMLVDVTAAALKSIAELVDANKLKTNVATVLRLSELRQAHEMLNGTRPRTRGKIVLEGA